MGILRGLLALALAFLAFNLKDPALFGIRPYETPGLLIWGMLLAVWAIQATIAQRRRRLAAWVNGLTVAVCLIAIAAILMGEHRFQSMRRSALAAPPVDLHRLGAHIIAGISDGTEAARLAETGAVGGFFLTRRNIEGKTRAAIRDEIRHLQDIRRDNGLCPLIFTTDQEGGPISRLSPPLTALPPIAEWIKEAATPEALAEKARAYGEIHGRELAELGITVNFAPLADLRIERPADPLDFKSLIASRAIASDPQRVSVVAHHYAEALTKYGVHATLKHFPGLGRVSGDTHFFPTTLDAPVAVLAGADWIPFRQVSASTSALMMLSHVRLGAVDPLVPVSYSKPVIDGIIRRDWHFGGVLITDDLTMGAVYHGPEGIGAAAVQSLMAGADLLLVSYDDEKLYEVLSALLQADRDGRLDRSILAGSAGRLRRTFRALGDCPLP